jgi:hypothetical protein
MLKIDVTTAGPLRTGLMRKGMIYSPEHGMTAFTVPMFDSFMRRAIPEFNPSVGRDGNGSASGGRGCSRWCSIADGRPASLSPRADDDAVHAEGVRMFQHRP